MAFTDLSGNLQNIILFNYDSFMKALFLGLFFFISAFYLFYYRPILEKKTIFWSVMLIRTIVSAFSFFGLLFAPYILLTLDPRYSFETFFNMYGMIYGSLMLIVMFVMLFDFTKWGFTFLIRLSGIDINSEEYGKFKKWYKNNLSR